MTASAHAHAQRPSGCRQANQSSERVSKQVNLVNYTPQSASRQPASQSTSQPASRGAAVHISPNTSGASVLPGAADDMVALHSIAAAGEAFPPNAQLCVLSSRTFVRCACAASSTTTTASRIVCLAAPQLNTAPPLAPPNCRPSCQRASKPVPSRPSRQCT